MEQYEKRRRRCKNLNTRSVTTCNGVRLKLAGAAAASITVLHQVVKALGTMGRPSLLNLHFKVSLRGVEQNGVCVGALCIHGCAARMKQSSGMWHRSMTSCSSDKKQEISQHSVHGPVVGQVAVLEALFTPPEVVGHRKHLRPLNVCIPLHQWQYGAITPSALRLVPGEDKWGGGSGGSSSRSPSDDPSSSLPPSLRR